MNRYYKIKNEFNEILRKLEQDTVGTGQTGLYPPDAKKDIIYSHFKAKQQNNKAIKNFSILFTSSVNNRTSKMNDLTTSTYYQSNNQKQLKVEKENEETKQQLNKTINYINETKSQMPYCKHISKGSKQIRALSAMNENIRYDLLNAILNSSTGQILSHTAQIKTVLRNLKRVKEIKELPKVYFYYVVVNPENSHISKNKLGQHVLRTTANQNPYDMIKRGYDNLNKWAKNQNRTNKNNYIKIIREHQETTINTHTLGTHNHDNLIILTTKGHQKKAIQDQVIKSYSSEMNVKVDAHINLIGKLTPIKPIHKNKPVHSHPENKQVENTNTTDTDIFHISFSINNTYNHINSSDLKQNKKTSNKLPATNQNINNNNAEWYSGRYSLIPP